MADKSLKLAAIAVLKQSAEPLPLSILVSNLSQIPERTLRRWLAAWVDEGAIERIGRGRATRYRYIGVKPVAPVELGFLHTLDDDLKVTLLSQLRDLWTHNSTAIEGNTLTLGDTHFLLEQGLTISGKPLKDHQEVIGHAKAIVLLYRCIDVPLTEATVFELHKAVQSEQVSDIYKPIGAWKVEMNGTYVVLDDSSQSFIEYAPPRDVPKLMAQLIDAINMVNFNRVTLDNAHQLYAKIHMGIAHIHPFWDGNGRIARLLANILLLKAGLPPLVIELAQRRTYIQTLASYQIAIGQLSSATGVWPDLDQLQDFEAFCEAAYSTTIALVGRVFSLQKKR